MCVYILVGACVCAYMRECVYACVCACVCVRVRACTRVYICAYIVHFIPELVISIHTVGKCTGISSLDKFIVYKWIIGKCNISCGTVPGFSKSSHIYVIVRYIHIYKLLPQYFDALVAKYLRT